MFVRSLYSGPLVMQSLLLNRRRNDRELHRNQIGAYVFSSNGNDLDEDDDDDDNDKTKEALLNTETEDNHAVPLIYACATMWHEEEDEMKALFKSLFRFMAISEVM